MENKMMNFFPSLPTPEMFAMIFFIFLAWFYLLPESKYDWKISMVYK